MLNSITGFHIEPTNICMLKCPSCSRTKFINQFGIAKWKNSQINLTDFKKFFDIDLTNKTFTLCGNYGDPIYYDSLFPMIDWIKNQGALVHIITNGSYRKTQWWDGLARRLSEKDSVIFSVDGSPDNFTNYRINADWPSIQIGIDIITKSQAKTIWKYIPFSFNVDSIESTRELSQQLGINEFQIDPSDRWDGENDPLQPREYTGPRESTIVQWRKNNSDILEVDAKCKTTYNQHYISADGFYMPCCFVGDHRFYYKSEFYKNKEKYSISNTTITEVLNNTQEFYDGIETSKPSYCTFNCPKI